MRRLKTGAALGLREALACWGARVTIRSGAWHIPDGRQDIVGDAAHQEELVRVLNDGVLQEAEQIERELYRQRAYPPGVVVVLMNREDLVVLTRRLDGYVFVTAFSRALVPRMFTRPSKKAARVSRRRS